MSSVLVVAYSRTGASRRVGQLMAGLQHWQFAQIRDAAPRRGFGGVVRCLLDSWRGRCPAIRYAGPDPANFEAVVLVSPIWAARLAGPMRSFVTAHREAFREVVVVSLMGGKGHQGAVAELAHLIGRAPLRNTAFKEREVQDGTFMVPLEAFAASVQHAVERAPLRHPVRRMPEAA